MSETDFAVALPLARFSARRRAFALRADAATRERLAARFGLAAIESLSADLEAWRADAGVSVEGVLVASVVQYCAVSGAPVAARIEERIAVRFLPQQPPVAEEIELAKDELDILPLLDGAVDLGELVAQSLYLALDPYPLAAGEVVEEARRRLDRGRSKRDSGDDAAVSPFARLKAR